MAMATLVVGAVTPLVQQEIEELGGTVRQISETPTLFLIQLPHQEWITLTPADLDLDAPEDVQSIQEDISINSAHGLLSVHSKKWICRYRGHPYDVTRTELRALVDDFPIEVDDLFYQQSGHETQEAIRGRTLTPYEQHRWQVACASSTFPGNEKLRQAFQSWITFEALDAPAIRQALEANQEELATLPEEQALLRTGQIAKSLEAQAMHTYASLCLEDQHTIRQFELGLRLEAFQNGVLTPQEQLAALEDFGTGHFLQARPAVERSLRHPQPEMRLRALETLRLYWRLAEHLETALQWLHAPDPDIRRRALRCLNPGRGPIRELRVLSAFADMVADDGELPTLRLSAYDELLAATHKGLSYDLWMKMKHYLDTGGQFSQIPGIDWGLVRFFVTDPNRKASTYQLALHCSSWEDEQEWDDAFGHPFFSQAVVVAYLVHLQQLVHARLSHFQMTVSFAPLDSALNEGERAGEGSPGSGVR